MKFNILFAIFIIFIIFLYIYRYKSNISEDFSELFINNNKITTWTPYALDCYNQPCYTNYFYNNGYMYPIY
jgi:hypothetical protein